MTIVVAVVWLVALRPVALGGPASYIVVRGHSMAGTLDPGDLLFTQAQASYSVGDTIVYRVPSGAGAGLLVVHRVVSRSSDTYIARGDANPNADPWRPIASDVVGRLAFTLPGGGRVLAWLANPFVLSALWAFAAFVVGLSFLPAAGRRLELPAHQRQRP